MKTEEFSALIDRALETRRNVVRRPPNERLENEVARALTAWWHDSAEGQRALSLLKLYNREVYCGGDTIDSHAYDGVVRSDYVLDGYGPACLQYSEHSAYDMTRNGYRADRHKAQTIELVQRLLRQSDESLGLTSAEAVIDWLRGEIAKIANEIITRHGA